MSEYNLQNFGGNLRQISISARLAPEVLNCRTEDDNTSNTTSVLLVRSLVLGFHRVAEAFSSSRYCYNGDRYSAISRLEGTSYGFRTGHWNCIGSQASERYRTIEKT